MTLITANTHSRLKCGLLLRQMQGMWHHTLQVTKVNAGISVYTCMAGVTALSAILPWKSHPHFPSRKQDLLEGAAGLELGLQLFQKAKNRDVVYMVIPQDWVRWFGNGKGEFESRESAWIHEYESDVQSGLMNLCLKSMCICVTWSESGLIHPAVSHNPVGTVMPYVLILNKIYK